MKLRVMDLQGISHRYSRGPRALTEINLSLNSGEVVGVIGDNGAGKSTLLNILAGSIMPTSGNVERSHERIAWTAQHQTIDWFVTVRTNVWIGARLAGLKGADAWSAADRALDKLGLTSKSRETPEGLSGGQQQRLMIARAIAMDADVLILDEPTVGLDVQNTKSIREEILRAKSRGAAVIVSSHDFEAIEPVVEKILFLSSGEVVYFGAVSDFVKAYAKRELIKFSLSVPLPSDVDLRALALQVDESDQRIVFADVAPGVALAPIVRLIEAHASIRDITRRPGSLRSAVEGLVS